MQVTLDCADPAALAGQSVPVTNRGSVDLQSGGGPPVPAWTVMTDLEGNEFCV